jgi:hypothetical protein
MGLNNVLEIFGFFEICKQFKHVLLDDFFREIVEETLYEFSNLAIGGIGYFEALDIRLTCVLKLHPTNIELPL